MPFFNDVFYDLRVPEQKREYSRVYCAEWRKKNPEKVKAILRRRYEKEKADPVLWRKRHDNKKKYVTEETMERNRRRSAALYAVPEIRAERLEKAKERYKNDEEYRQRMIKQSKERYARIKGEARQQSS
jgi:hypothetical protein